MPPADERAIAAGDVALKKSTVINREGGAQVTADHVKMRRCVFTWVDLNPQTVDAIYTLALSSVESARNTIGG
jgi:hypothetical protein